MELTQSQYDDILRRITRLESFHEVEPQPPVDRPQWLVDWETGISPPLLSHWTSREQNMHPRRQIALLQDGVPYLPHIRPPHYWQQTLQETPHDQQTINLLDFCQRFEIPLTIVTMQPEGAMLLRPEFRHLPMEQSPNVWVTDAETGEIKSIKLLSWAGDPAAWADCGERWAAMQWLHPVTNAFRRSYKCIWLSNNEPSFTTFATTQRQTHYLEDIKFVVCRLERFGGAELTRDEYMRIERTQAAQLYPEMFRGLRQVANTVIGYGMNNFRLQDYETETGYGIEQTFWDGCSPALYNRGDPRLLACPLTEFTSIIPLDGLRRSEDEGWHYEMSVWHNGSAASINMWEKWTGTVYHPDQYEGFVKMGAWLTRPRVVREWIGHADGFDDPVLSDAAWERLESEVSVTGDEWNPDTPRYTNGDFWDACQRAVGALWDSGVRDFLESGELLTDGVEWPVRMWSTEGPLRVPNWLYLCNADLANRPNPDNQGRWPVTAFIAARRIGADIMGLAVAPMGDAYIEVTINGVIVPVHASPRGEWFTM